MTPDPADRAEELLAGHVEWVRALARRIASDAENAEDLAQDALVVALRTRPSSGLKFRPWIAAVMRNLARQDARGSSRRETREERAARPESGDRLVDEVVAGRELAQAVLDLAEPYRTALLMRFWENAPPREIARRLGVPVATVNSRLARGLAQLRERYDGGDRDEGRRLAALAPLLAPIHAPAHAALPALSLGGLVLNAKLVLSAAVAAAIAVVLWGIAPTRETGAGPERATAGELAPPPRTAGSNAAIALDETPGGAARVASPAPEPPAPEAIAAPAAEVPVRVVSGLLLDADGAPLTGVTVGTRDASARSSGAGRFWFDTRSASASIAVLEPGWVTVREGTWRAESAVAPLVVAARELAVAGSVVDARGDPIQDARVELALPRDFAMRFETSLEASRSRAFGATTDARGRFELPPVPAVAGARVRAAREGWLAAEVDLPQASDDELRVVLSRPEIPLAGALRGTVVDPDGNPVAEARVFLGLATTTTDERGRFGIELARAVTSDRVVAVKSGRLPGMVERQREPRAGDTGWPESVVITIGGEPLSIRGIVRDHAGEPRAGMRVSIADPTAIGTIGRMPATAEGMASGAAIPPFALESDGREPKQDDEHHHGLGMDVGPPTAFWNYAITDASGRFSIGGLGDRRYKLRISDPKTRLALTTQPISAGDHSADVRMPEPDVWRELRGRVVDDAGEPVAGVQVGSLNEAYGVRARVFGGDVTVSLQDYGDTTVSDAEGRFVLRDVPRAGTVLTLTSERTVPHDRPLGEDVDPAEVVVEVALRCSFEVRVAPGTGPEPDGFSLHDGRDEQLQIFQIEPNHVRSHSIAALLGGRSGVLSASSAARTLHLFRAGQPLRSVPIRLRGGEANVIDL